MTGKLIIRYLVFISLNLVFISCYSQNYTVGRNPYVTQLHIHGWSNHNGSAKPGSLQYHNWQSDSVGVDVIWWSEHDPLYTQATMLFSLNGAVVDPVTLDINLPTVGTANPSLWECVLKEGATSATVSNDTLMLSLITGGGATTFRRFAYSPRSTAGLIKGFGFPKPMACKPVFEFNTQTTFGNPATSGLSFIFRLAWHYRQQEGQDIITFRLVPDTIPSSMSTNNVDSVWVNVPVAPGWQQVSLEIWNAAQLLDHGIDNTISDMELQLSAMLGSAVNAAFNDFKLVPTVPVHDTIIQSEKNVLEDYSASYHTHNILGVEWSGEEHLNGYFPKSVNNHQIFDANFYPTEAAWANAIHLNGGLVSYNHMFGTDWSIDSVNIQDYRTDTMTTYLLSIQAYDADILEVGYYKRGGADFEHHLATWDKLTANGLFLYGNGVSDSHGNLWITQTEIFHTYIWATDSSDTELLASLSLGKMYFGNHMFFKGELYYTLGNLEMGDRGFITQNNVQPILHVTQLPAGSQIRLTQVLLDSTMQLTYLHNETLVDTTAMPVLDMTQPSFIRIGIYDSAGVPLVFGQPIVILGLQTGLVDTNVPENTLIKIFPNPATDKLNLEFTIQKDAVYSVCIYDMQSRKVGIVDEKFFYSGRHGYSVKTDHLKVGAYFVKITGKDFDQSKRFVIE